MNITNRIFDVIDTVVRNGIKEVVYEEFRGWFVVIVIIGVITIFQILFNLERNVKIDTLEKKIKELSKNIKVLENKQIEEKKKEQEDTLMKKIEEMLERNKEK